MTLRRYVIAAVLGLSLVAAACGDDDDSSSSGTTAAATTAAATTTAAGATTTAGGATTSGTGGNAQLCEDRDALKTSITSLDASEVVSGGVEGLQSKLTEIKDNLAAVRASAGDQLQPEIDDFQTALQDLETAVQNVGSGGVAGLVPAVTKVVQAGSTLVQSLDELEC
jgi:hypothetical protein